MNDREWDWRRRSKSNYWNGESEHKFEWTVFGKWEWRLKKRMNENKNEGWITGCRIRAEGAKAMSELLKANTSLTSLNLRSEGGGKKENEEKISKRIGSQTMRLELKEHKQ